VTIRRGSINLGGSADTPNFSVTSNGSVMIKYGSIRIGGTESAPNFHVDSSGNITANNGTFKGYIYADRLYLGNSNSLNSSNQITGNYLDLKQVYVSDLHGRRSFQVDSSGNVYIGNGTNTITYNASNGTVTLGGGVSLSWNSVTDKPTITPLPSYAKSTYIDFQSVSSPYIVGGRIYAGSPTQQQLNNDQIGTIRGAVVIGGSIDGAVFNNATALGYRISIENGELKIMYFNTLLGKMSALTNRVEVWGAWDFTSASVSGLNSTARWG